MDQSRRSFLLRSAGAAGAMLFASSCGNARATSGEILVNHVGFTPAAGKFCVMAGTSAMAFEVIDAANGNAVHKGRLEPRKGDHGDYLVGDFSAVRAPGKYHIKTASSQSGPVPIGDTIYLPAVRNSIRYFAAQRCGQTCHLDDGVRKDNGERLDVTGGWHDACDLRRWVDATIYGIIGLSHVLDALGPQDADAQRIIEEMRWGNRYFLKMQDPAGFVMYYCGGDDGNHFTDNVNGTADDRQIQVDPVEMTAQFNFVAAQAMMVRHTRKADPAYAKTCENAGEKALSWCLEKGTNHKAATIGAAVLAFVELHRTFGCVQSRELAAKYLRALLALQDADIGFFRARADRPDPSREIMDGNLPLLALCDAIAVFPDHADAATWRTALQRHVDHLVALSRLSAFGTIPFGLYAGADPGGGRRIGNHFYRWSMKTTKEYRDDDWWVGLNAHLASHGVGMLRAGKLLDRPELADLAQRQLDWILGVNPFNASTVTGAGRNQPKLFKAGEFKPPTPLIPGGVMNGLGGTALDGICINPGSWNTCEYWTPMVAYTMRLMAELRA